MVMIGALVAHVIQVGLLRKWLLFFATFPLMFAGYLGRDLLALGLWSTGEVGWGRRTIHDFDPVLQLAFVVAGLIALGWFFNWQRKRSRVD
ncbi:MAG: hypothetical protein ACJAQT_003924 [Akkermansiaceae bacterium]|jgi:hypothetical protein